MSLQTESFYYNFIAWLRSHGYVFTGDPPTYSGGGIITPGTITPLLIDPAARLFAAAAGIPVDTLIWGSLASGLKGDNYLFAEFGDYDHDDFPITDTGTNITHSATAGWQKTASGTADYINLDAIAPAIAAASSLSLFCLIRKDHTGTAYTLRFSDGSQFAVAYNANTELITINSRNDAGTGTNISLSTIGAIDDWCMCLFTWDWSGGTNLLNVYAIDDNGVFESASGESTGAHTWIASVDEAQLLHTNESDFRLGFICTGVLTESDFWSMSRIAADYARAQGVTFSLLRANAEQWFYTWIDSAYTVTTGFAKVTGWATSGIEETEAFTLGGTTADETDIEDPGLYEIEATATFQGVAGAYIPEVAIARDTGGGASIITGARSVSGSGGVVSGTYTSFASVSCRVALNTGDQIEIQAKYSGNACSLEYGQWTMRRVA